MDSKKFSIFIGAVVATILGIALISALAAPHDAHSYEILLFSTVIAFFVATEAFTIFGIVVAIKDRSYAWAVAIFVSGAAFPASIILTILYLKSIRKQDSKAELPAAGWYEDPVDGHDLRYWNGTTWSDIISDGGCVSREATVLACHDA